MIITLSIIIAFLLIYSIACTIAGMQEYEENKRLLSEKEQLLFENSELEGIIILLTKQKLELMRLLDHTVQLKSLSFTELSKLEFFKDVSKPKANTFTCNNPFGEYTCTIK